MVYTVTFNPSIDYIVAVDDFKLGMTNRTSSELVHPGGKGVNVSVILNNLGIENTAFGFTAGFTGKAIAAMIEQQGVKADFIEIDEGLSRINFKLESVDGTEINGRGPDISEAKVEELLSKLDTLKAGDVVVLAGSIPHSMSDDIYRTILKRLEGKGVLSVVDATSTLLMNVLEYHPFLIKPNQHELGEIYNVELKTKEEVVPYARKMHEAGARNVLISMGGMGAVLVAEDGSTYSAPAPKGILKNSVGSGDSMVAGFMTGWLRTGSYEEAFKMGVAAGSASAFSDYLATKDEVEEVLKRVEVS
jgi:1-phosphofructokinase